MDTPAATAVTIGANKDAKGKYVQTQTGKTNKNHIDGIMYPMYGSQVKVSKTQNPRVKMKHLSALVAIKIVNQGTGGGSIIINNAEFGVPEITSGQDKQSEIKVVGDFKVNFTGSEPAFEALGNSSSKAVITLDEGIEIQPGEANAATLYLAVRPFKAAAGTILEIGVNGSTRRVKMTKDVKFEAGKVTTLKVPVKDLTFGPTITNALSIKSTGMKNMSLVSWNEVKNTQTVTFNNYSTETIVVNGKEVNAYVIGTDNAPGTITIKGTPAELFKYIPATFYAASYHNKKSVMRVESISAGFKVWVILWEQPIALTMTYDDLTGGDDPIIADVSKINFQGLLPLEQYVKYDKKHLVILDEEPIHKQIDTTQIHNLLQRFDYDTKDKQVPTFKGLNDAINNTSLINQEGTQAHITATNIYNKLYSKLSSNSIVSGVFDWVFGKGAKEMFDTILKTPIHVTLSTTAPEDEEGDYRVVIWGLNSPEAQ